MAKYKVDPKARYATTHEWARMEDGIAIIGISDAAQDLLSDVVFVELPENGRTVVAGEAVAVVESVKAAEDVLSPVSGVVVARNEQLIDAPESVNEDPYGAWFFKVQPATQIEAELAALMDHKAYAAFAEENTH